ncbi:MAG: FUSC family protein [Oscillospiraceae bacterium]
MPGTTERTPIGRAFPPCSAPGAWGGAQPLAAEGGLRGGHGPGAGPWSGLSRPMWMGIAAMSVLLPSRQAIPGRVKGRIWGNLAGGAGFCLLYCLLPGSLLPYLGIFGGIGVGLSATYGWQAVFNSLGAMSIMVGTLGLPGVVLFRVGNNALGALYAWAVDRLAGPAWRVLRRAAS